MLTVTENAIFVTDNRFASELVATGSEFAGEALKVGLDDLAVVDVPREQDVDDRAGHLHEFDVAKGVLESVLAIGERLGGFADKTDAHSEVIRVHVPFPFL